MTVFYRKYRPQKLVEVIGQDHVVKTLGAQLERGKISHAYLFAGPKGLGKTTTARILAKAVNCSQFTVHSKGKTVNREPRTENFVFGEPCDQCDSCQAILTDRHFDVIEIDAASNRGIDDIRNLREKIKLAPVMGRYKVYVVDEVHMLTTEAFNALLKTLEEPPPHAIFILCTTQAEKLPATIISRCQRFDFIRAREKELIGLLKKVVEKEGLEIREDLLERIAKRADGSFRDALSFLDQLTLSEFTQDEIEKVLSYSSAQKISDFSQYLIDQEAKGAILALNHFVEMGVDLKVFLADLLSWLRHLLLHKEGVGEILSFSQFTPEIYQKLKNQEERVSRKKILELLKFFSIAALEIKNSPIPQLPVEIAIAQSCPEEEQIAKEGSKVVDRGEIEKRIQTAPEKETKKKSTPSNLPIRTTLKRIRDDWPKIIEIIEKRSSSLSALLSRCQPASLKDERLILGVSFKFHKERLEEQKNRYLIETTLADFFGQPIRIEFLLEKDLTK
jgi:DNA polymerase-3 subunit gamma/tau